MIQDREPTDTSRIHFPALSPRAYEHPADRAALVALRAVPGFDLALRKLFSLVGERSIRLIYLGSAVRVNERQFKDIDHLYQECLEVLDVPERPDLFISRNPFVNAGAIGVDRPFIVVNSASLELMTSDELRVVLAHELGHVLSGHALYKTMLQLLIRLSVLSYGVPLSMLAVKAVVVALKEWDRKSELSADRAGALVAQDPATNFRVQMKMAGGSRVGEMCLEEFLNQSEEYQSRGGVLDSVLKLFNVSGQSHPFPVLRVAELKQWIEGGEYETILDGTYPKRTEDDQASVAEELAASARSYRERYHESKDPLATFFRDLSNQVASAGGRVKSRFSRRK